jgi:hypothetical protein
MEKENYKKKMLNATWAMLQDGLSQHMYQWSIPKNPENKVTLQKLRNGYKVIPLKEKKKYFYIRKRSHLL